MVVESSTNDFAPITQETSDMSTGFDAPTTAIDDITGDYTLDVSHSRLGFVARHAMVTKVRGQFGAFEGTARIDEANPSASKVDLTIQVASVDTGSADRDGHLKSGDFFDAETYPTMTFTSTDVKRDGSDWTITGDLTIKDVTKPVTIDFDFEGAAVDPFGNQRVGLSGVVKVNRKDFGLTWNAALETGGVLVSDEITLSFEVSAIKSDDAAAPEVAAEAEAAAVEGETPVEAETVQAETVQPETTAPVGSEAPARANTPRQGGFVGWVKGLFGGSSR